MNTIATLVLLPLLVTTTLATPAAAANLIGNGGLEVVPDPGPGSVILGTSSNALAPWIVSRGDVEEIGTFYWAAADGHCSLALNGTTAGGVAQNFSTVPGGLYGVSFSLSGDALSVPAVKHIRVTAAGSSIDYAFDTTPCWHWDMAWQRKSWQFNAVSSTTTLEFYSLEAGSDTGPAIDSVEVTLLSLVGAEDAVPGLALAAVSPNPTSGATSIAWSLPARAQVRLAIHDVRGRTVAVLEQGEQPAGNHSTRWDALGIAPGIYLVSLETGGERLTRRLAVIP